MKKAAFILGLSIMAALSLIAWNATRNTILKDETVELATLQSHETENVTIEEKEIPSETNSIEETETEAETEADEAVKIDEAEKERLIQSQGSSYAFAKLNAEEQTAYAEILAALTNFEKDVILTTKLPDVMDKAFQCVMMDHPEIFYIDGYQYTKYTVGDTIAKMSFCGNYTYSREEAEQLITQINAAAAQIINGISKDSSDYEKVKYIYETIVNNTEYVLNAQDNQNICSVFLYHQSVCQGYAKTMQYLLNKLDVPTTLVVGTVKNGEGHAWNLVCIDGTYYYVDCTWGDAYYLLSNQDMESTNGKTPSINYDYLCVTTQQIQETHTINTIVQMPDCSSMTANYYVMEGSYFTEYDEEKVRAVFSRAQDTGREAVTLKCATMEVYYQMLSKLIDEQQVFHFYPNLQGSIAYTTCEEQRSISFWL